MPQLPSDVRVFLSSTFMDLHSVREEVARRLSEVLGSRLITMETFGSDEAPPDIHSVRRVRETDIFVAIYAHRYGTVDSTTGKSITELELDEAERAHSEGTLLGILLYVVDETALWPADKIETSPSAQAALRRLKERTYRHTVTRFRKEEDLPFFVIRDVLVKVRERLIGAPLVTRAQSLPPETKINRPVGMEFLRSTDRRYLTGRTATIDEIFGCLENEPVVLLLGNSGVGKTSLIHAGLFPRAISNGWRVVYTRPFGLPWSDVVTQLQASVFDGRPGYRGPLPPLLGELLAAIDERGLLLVIDQFEDVLLAREPREIEQLVADLRIIRELAQPTLHILISYRADLEARVGKYWQQISGASSGLPRIYLSGVSAEEAWAGIQRTITDLGVKIDIEQEDEAKIKDEFLLSSQAVGQVDVYPPYVQMLIDHIWQHFNTMETSYRAQEYRDAGGMEGIIAGFLGRQLAYARDTTGHLRIVLVALVRGYGSKTQRTIQEICAETGLTARECEESLEQLIDLRLVRHISESYEIAHDFLARRVFEELVDTEEKEFKRFRELLSSKAAAFATTQAPLTPDELLVLFKYKERILPSEAELRILLFSWLGDQVPALFWLLSARPTSLLEWLRSEDDKEGSSREGKAASAMLRRKLGDKLTEKDYISFHHYQLSAELSSIIVENPIVIPERTLIWGLRNWRPEIKASCFEAVVKQINTGKQLWIPRLRNSTSKGLRSAYESLVTSPDVLFSQFQFDRDFTEFTLMRELAHSKQPNCFRSLLKSIRALRPKERTWTLAQALAMVRGNRFEALLKAAQRTSADRAAVLCTAIHGNVTSKHFDHLLEAYAKVNNIEPQRDPWGPVRIRANALAQAILRSSSKSHLGALRKVFKFINLTPSAQAFALALIKYGSTRDLFCLLNRIAANPEQIDMWHHIEIARTVARRMEQISDRKAASELQRLAQKRDFYEYPDDNIKSDDLLPLTDRRNRPLFIRLVAYALIGLANNGDQEILCRLAKHPYHLIARAAAIRLIRISGADGMKALASTATERIKPEETKSLAAALRDAEMEQYGLASLW